MPPTYTDTKNLLLSKTIWGGIFLLTAFVLQTFGYDFSAEDQSTAADTVISSLSTIFAAIGSIGVLVGRITAQKKVTVLPKKGPAVLALVLLSTLAGCQAISPHKQFENEDARLITSVNDESRVVTALAKMLPNAHKLGWITTEQYRAILKHVNQADHDLRVAEGYIDVGDYEAARKSFDAYKQIENHIDAALETLSNGSRPDDDRAVGKNAGTAWYRRSRGGQTMAFEWRHYRRASQICLDAYSSGARAGCWPG